MKNVREVNVRKRADGLYELRYTILGKQKSIYGKSIAVCRAKYADILKINKKVRIYKSMLFSTWVVKYIDLFKKSVLSPSSLKNMAGNFQKHILPYIGKKTLKQIHCEDIQLIVNNMCDLPRQQTIVFDQLNACLNQAVKVGYIENNPCAAVSIKKHKGKRGSALTHEELNILIKYLQTHNPPITNLIYLYLSTGMRRNELLNVRYEDLNFEKSEIFVRGTKTANSKRTIQVPLKVLNLFPKQSIPFVDWTYNRVDREFKKICDILHFKGVVIHSLRHTFATNCVEAGVPPVTLQKWLGHSTISITMDVYTHISDDFKRQSVDALNYDFIP